MDTSIRERSTRTKPPRTRRVRGRRRRLHDILSGKKQSITWLATAALLCSDMVIISSTTTTMAFTQPIPFHAFRPAARTISLSGGQLCMVDTSLATKGLSRYVQNIMSRTSDRQRFVTGKYPVIVSIEENPTQKWLDKDSATSLMLVNDTIIDQSLASYDRFQWLDEHERHELHDRYASLSLELLAEIHIAKPGYLQILPSGGAGSSTEALCDANNGVTKWNRWKKSSLYEELILGELQLLNDRAPLHDRLWVTGFSFAGRKGMIKSMDARTGHIDSVNPRSEAMTLWPNEVNSVPKTLIATNIKKDNDDVTTTAAGNNTEVDALLVSDGFLVPGKDRGGIYVVQDPGNPNSEWTTCLTSRTRNRWFYHRAVWVDLTGDGRLSILTARAKLRKVADQTGNSEKDSRPKNGQLVMLEMPKPNQYDTVTGTPLEEDGTAFDPFSARHLPWREKILAAGPDVMFNIADLDTNDDTIEVIASQFFDKKVTLHSILRGPEPRVTFTRVIDDKCGAAFGGILANLDPAGLNPSYRRVVDSGSTMHSVKPGDTFSHVLVTSHECNYADSDQGSHSRSNSERDDDYHHHHAMHNGKSESSSDGGSVFAYRVPVGKDAWKTETWTRTTVATGFKVKGQIWNVINPGAPGFVYTFHAHKDDAEAGKQPMIAVAGDCADSAYIFRPVKVEEHRSQSPVDPHAQYKLMCEIKCGATVGSIGVGYDDLCDAEQESGYAKLYIPCYEKDRILVFALGSGENAAEEDAGWFEV